MSTPTIEARLQKRLAVMTADSKFIEQTKALLPDDWKLAPATDLDQLGDWHQLLLYRFLLLDLDEVDAFDPLDVMAQIRMQYQINLPVFCFGGDEAIREEMRLSRADRFFDRDEMIARLPEFIEQYQW